MRIIGGRLVSKTAFIFPGQGSQSVGMGSEFYQNYPEAKEVFETAGEELGFSMTELCFSDPQGKLNHTAYTQPSLLTASVAAYEVLSAHGIKADYVAGHSLGEYSGLVANGALSLGTAVKLVHQRGTFMNEAVPAGKGAMAAILGMEKEILEEICQQASHQSSVEIGNYNCPGQLVISGLKEGVLQAGEAAREKGAKKVIPLQVSGPFHSSLMAIASDKLAEVLQDIEIQKPTIPSVTNVTGQLVTDPAEIMNNLILQVKRPVRWEQCIQKLVGEGVNLFIEVGPGKVLSGLIKKISKDVQVLNVEDQKSLEKTLATIKGGE